MADLPPDPDFEVDTGDDPGVGPGESTTSAPRWVKVFGILVLVLVLLFAIVLLTGVGGEHGPDRHLLSGDTSLSRATERGLPQP